MRYVVSDDRPIGIEDIRSAFGTGYELDGDDSETTIAYAGRPIGQVTLNVPGDGLFDEERDELIEFVEDEDDQPAKGLVIQTLRNARAIVAVQVLFGNDDTDGTLDSLGPLWTWLRANRRGLMQADGEGYYDGGQLILPLE